MVMIVGDYQVLIDDSDFPKVKRFHWGMYKQDDRVIIRCTTKNPEYKFLHRLLMGVTDPKLVVDHINGDTLDNRRKNLRVCTSAQNVRNCKKSRRNTSGFKGVSLAKSTGKWLAYISVNMRNKYLGSFATPEEAHAAYCEAAKKYHGEFARFE